MTRMIVPAQKDRDGVPTGCTGVTMEDGTVYRANRAGHMEVSRQDHVAAMLRNGDGFVVKESGAAAKVPGTTCASCGFAGYPHHASAPCPRCGGEMLRDQPQGEEPA